MFNIIEKDKSFSKPKTRRWIPRSGEETSTKLKELLEPKSQNDIELDVKEVGKRAT